MTILLAAEKREKKRYAAMRSAGKTREKMWEVQDRYIVWGGEKGKKEVNLG